MITYRVRDEQELARDSGAIIGDGKDASIVLPHAPLPNSNIKCSFLYFRVDVSVLFQVFCHLRQLELFL